MKWTTSRPTAFAHDTRTMFTGDIVIPNMTNDEEELDSNRSGEAVAGAGVLNNVLIYFVRIRPFEDIIIIEILNSVNTITAASDKHFRCMQAVHVWHAHKYVSAVEFVCT